MHDSGGGHVLITEISLRLTNHGISESKGTFLRPFIVGYRSWSIDLLIWANPSFLDPPLGLPCDASTLISGVVWFLCKLVAHGS